MKYLIGLLLVISPVTSFAQMSARALDMEGRWKGTGKLRDARGERKYTSVAVNAYSLSDPNVEVLLEDYQWEDGRKNRYKFVLRFSGSEFTIDPSEPEEFPQFSGAMGHCYSTGGLLPNGKNFCHHMRYMPDGSVFQALIIKEDDNHLSIVRMNSKNGAMISTMESSYERAP